MTFKDLLARVNGNGAQIACINQILQRLRGRLLVKRVLIDHRA